MAAISNFLPEANGHISISSNNFPGIHSKRGGGRDNVCGNPGCQPIAAVALEIVHLDASAGENAILSVCSPKVWQRGRGKCLRKRYRCHQLVDGIYAAVHLASSVGTSILEVCAWSFERVKLVCVHFVRSHRCCRSAIVCYIFV